jgi:hypothetical protein
VAYSSECGAINRAIEEAKELFQDMQGENVIESYFGSRMTDAVRSLDDALGEVSYIEDAPDTDDVDLTEVYRNADKIDDLIDEVEAKMQDIRDHASEIRTDTRNYR